jgi:hypothetical protein
MHPLSGPGYFFYNLPQGYLSKAMNASSMGSWATRQLMAEKRRQFAIFSPGRQ